MFGELHTHIIMDGVNYKDAVAIHRQGPCEAVVRERLEAYRSAGIAFIRDGGDHMGVSMLARALAPEYGIKYLSPSHGIHRKGLYGAIVGHAFEDEYSMKALIDSAAKDGADFIKLMASGILDFSEFGALSPGPLPKREIVSFVKHAHSLGLAVMVHVNGDATVRDCIEAGADSIEHGFYMHRGTLDLFRGDDAPVWVPTVAVTDALMGCGRFDEENLSRIHASQMANIRRALEIGANVALGSDCGAYRLPHPEGLGREYRCFRQAGEGINDIDGMLERGEALIRERFAERRNIRRP
ncbi:MAG: amidohydrolase family protein [Eubacteriaceae bacterium]|nr:amidohydrolase family protein [Eubacteriaceae bacterium]